MCLKFFYNTNIRDNMYWCVGLRVCMCMLYVCMKLVKDKVIVSKDNNHTASLSK